MTNITLQKQHRTLWHFIPGLALSAVITGVALWGGSIPAVAGAGFSALTRSDFAFYKCFLNEFWQMTF